MKMSEKYSKRPERKCAKCGVIFSGYRCKECVKKRKREYTEKNREAIYEYNRNWIKPLTIRADPQLLRQVMQNLLGNALDAVAGQGSIAVRTSMHLNFAVISVTDTGPGIAPSVQADLFKEGTSTKQGQHSGLGLAIVQRLMQRMGGSVACESNRGSTVFSLTFPP